VGKKRFIGIVAFAAFSFTALALLAQDVYYFKPFNIYTDKGARDNHYIPSGYMGDYNDVFIGQNCREKPHSGKTCIKVSYKPNMSQRARWVGVYWQHSPNNWGEREGGYDIRGARKLTFWARGKEGGEIIDEVKIGGVGGVYPDSDAASMGPIILSKHWQQYMIDLEGKDLSYISGGFCWTANLDTNKDGATFYLDDIRYE